MPSVKVIKSVDTCISSGTIKKLYKDIFDSDTLPCNKTENNTNIKSIQQTLELKPFEVTKPCPVEFTTNFECHNGGTVKCKFWNDKIIGIPFCHCTRDFAGQYCDHPMNVAFLKMRKLNDIPEQTQTKYSIII
uniref:EGF-like domain-containing protein n=1 Tax=Parastrongyloides trichosuri TaxID=131310 RepID=A0A0N4ZCB0_PARTI